MSAAGAEPNQQAGAVYLDWRDSSHWSPAARPCVSCERTTNLRNDAGDPQHKGCAEAALAHRAAPVPEPPAQLKEGIWGVDPRTSFFCDCCESQHPIIEHRKCRSAAQGEPEPAHPQHPTKVPGMPTADELWARVQAAEKTEARTALQRQEIGDPAPDWSPEYEAADQAARTAWLGAEGARHDLDAFLNPERYAEKGYAPEALDGFRAQAGIEAEPEA